MKAQRIYLFLLCLVPAAMAGAQQQADTARINSLEEVISTAVEHNPSQAVYKQQVLQAEYNHKASKGFMYPNASAAFNGTDNLHLSVTPVPGELIGQPGTTYYAQFGKKFAYSTGITLTQNVFNWTSVMQTRITGSNTALAQLQQDAWVQSLKQQVAQLYYSALVAQSALQIAEADRRLADSIRLLAQQRLQEGSTDQLNVNQAAINVSNVQQNMAQSRQLYDQSVANLKIIAGSKPATELLLTEKLNPDALAAADAPSLGIDKSLAVYNQQAAIAVLQSRSQRATAYPVIGATGYFGSQQYRNDFGLTFGKNDWNGYRYLGLNVSVPLFTGLSNSYKYKSTKVQERITAIQYDNAKQQSEINDMLLKKNYADYQDLVTSAASSFHLYGDNLKLNRQKYEEGVIGLDVYLKAFQDYLTAENTYLNNLSQLLSAKAVMISRQ